MQAIARRLDLNFKTVRRYLRADSVDSLLAGGVRASALDAFKPYLHDRLANGERNAAMLRVKIAEQGYTGGHNTLARYLRPPGSPAFRVTSTRTTPYDCMRSGPAAPSWTAPSGTLPAAPG